MKIMGKLGISILGLALLGWVAGCAGTDAMMDKESASDMQGQMASGMDHKMASGMDHKMSPDMDHKMSPDMDHKMSPDMDHKMSPDMDHKMASGMDAKMGAMLMGSGGHHASGTVTFGMGMHDRRVLILKDLKVDKVPDGYVYLAKNGDWMNGVELGKLNKFSGNVSFALPAGIDPMDFDSVIIWCKKFNVEIGRARLTQSHHRN
jgi:hypothetical protein